MQDLRAYTFVRSEFFEPLGRHEMNREYADRVRAQVPPSWSVERQGVWVVALPPGLSPEPATNDTCNCRAERPKAVRLLPVGSPTLAAATVDSGPRSALLQDGNRIDGGCTPGGHVAGHRARRGQQHEHTEPDERVARADAEQQARERPGQDG